MLKKTGAYRVERDDATAMGLSYVWKGAEKNPLNGPMPGSIVLDKTGHQIGVVAYAHVAFDPKGHPTEDYFFIDPTGKAIDPVQAAQANYDRAQSQLQPVGVCELVHT